MPISPNPRKLIRRCSTSSPGLYRRFTIRGRERVPCLVNLGSSPGSEALTMRDLGLARKLEDSLKLIRAMCPECLLISTAAEVSGGKRLPSSGLALVCSASSSETEIR